MKTREVTPQGRVNIHMKGALVQEEAHSERTQSTYVNTAKSYSDGKKKIFLFSWSVRSLVTTCSCAITTEADHRPLGYINDKPLVSSWS